MIGDAHGHLGCEQFHLRRFTFRTLALVQKMRDLLPVSARLRDFCCHVGKGKAERLELADRMAELLALLQVGPRVLDCRTRNADRPSCGMDACDIEPALNTREAARVRVRAFVSLEASEPVPLRHANAF